VAAEGAQLHLRTSPADVATGAKMLGAADRLRFLLPTVHAQMLNELKWPGRDDLHSGLDVRSLEMDATGFAALALLARGDVMGHLSDWRAGAILSARTEMAVATSSAIALITILAPIPPGTSVWCRPRALLAYRRETRPRLHRRRQCTCTPLASVTS